MSHSPMNTQSRTTLSPTKRGTAAKAAQAGKAGSMTVLKAAMGEDYNEHSTYQRRCAEPLAELLEHVVDELCSEGVTSETQLALRPSDKASFVLLDCGSSGGANASCLTARTLDRLYTHAAAAGQRPYAVRVYHEDLPNNTWAALFDTVHRGGSGYVRTHTRDGHEVYAFGVGRSMYERVLPPCSAHIVMTANALHWMDSVPVMPHESPFVTGDPNIDPTVVRTLTDHKLKEISTFLSHRSAELVPGGRLCIAIGAKGIERDGDPKFGLGSKWHVDLMAKGLHSCIRTLIEEGSLSEAFARNLVLPVHLTTVNEFLSLFTTHKLPADIDIHTPNLLSTPYHHPSLPLTLQSVRVDVFDTPYFETFKQDLETAGGDVRAVKKAVDAYVQGLGCLMSAAMNPTFAAYVKKDLQDRGKAADSSTVDGIVQRITVGYGRALSTTLMETGPEEVAGGRCLLALHNMTVCIVKDR